MQKLSKRFSKVPSGVLAWIIMELAKLLKILFHSFFFFFFLAFFIVLPTFQLNEPFGDNHLLVDPDFTDIREVLLLVPMGERVSHL